MFKKLMILCVLTFLTLALVACGGGDYPRRTDDTNTLYVGRREDSFPDSFMPWLSREGLAPTVSSMIYNTLFSYDTETGEFDPLIGKEWYYVDDNNDPLLTEDGEHDYEQLAEIYDTPEKDYIPVKITLHDDVTWSDGEPLTVEDIYFSLDVGSNHAVSNHAGALAWTADLQHEYDEGELINQGIFTYERGAEDAGYDIPEEDKDTVMYLHVDKILGAVTSLFTSMLILPEHIWEPIICEDNPLNHSNPDGELLEQYKNPVGSGPWELDAEESGSQQIVLDRRDEYHLRGDDGGPLYTPETIRYILYQEVNVGIYSLLKGHIDILDESVPPEYRRLFEDEENIVLGQSPSSAIETLVLNVNPVDSELTPERKLLTDRDFRKAIALAIDQEYLIDNVLEGAGGAVSPGLMHEHMEDFYNPDASKLPEDREERIEKANDILDDIVPEKDDSGYRLLDGDRITYEILGHPGQQDTVSYLQVLFADIGIDVRFEMQGARPERTFLYHSRFDMTLQGCIFSLENIDIMYESHFVNLGATSNYGRLQNEELTSIIREMRGTLNLFEKYELIEEIQPLIAEQYYKIPVYRRGILSVARDDRYIGYQEVIGANLMNTDTLENLEWLEE